VGSLGGQSSSVWIVHIGIHLSVVMLHVTLIIVHHFQLEERYVVEIGKETATATTALTVFLQTCTTVWALFYLVNMRANFVVQCAASNIDPHHSHGICGPANV
jgi:hypothetical protein